MLPNEELAMNVKSKLVLPFKKCASAILLTLLSITQALAINQTDVQDIPEPNVLALFAAAAVALLIVKRRRK
jgi:hypothetical protein